MAHGIFKFLPGSEIGICFVVSHVLLELRTGLSTYALLQETPSKENFLEVDRDCDTVHVQSRFNGSVVKLVNTAVFKTAILSGICGFESHLSQSKHFK